VQDERRRHRRQDPPVQGRLVVRDCAQGAARVLDLSLGGALVELPAGSTLPAMGARGQLWLTRGARTVMRGARVVRVRFSGREQGQPLPPAVALVFDDGDAGAAALLAGLIEGVS
jgi:hypothetical protein